MSGQTINVIIREEPDPPPRHPCLIGAHAWAWAQLTSGGTRQVCRRCGTERRR